MNLNLDDAGQSLLDYPNLPRTIGAALSSRMASLRELQEFYSIGDVYDMLEVVSVDAHNRKALMPKGSDS